jgi:hypothetical protein
MGNQINYEKVDMSTLNEEEKCKGVLKCIELNNIDKMYEYLDDIQSSYGNISNIKYRGEYYTIFVFRIIEDVFKYVKNSEIIKQIITDLVHKYKFYVNSFEYRGECNESFTNIFTIIDYCIDCLHDNSVLLFKLLKTELYDMIIDTTDFNINYVYADNKTIFDILYENYRQEEIYEYFKQTENEAFYFQELMKTL